MITHEEKKKFKSIVYSNIILSFLMLIIELLFKSYVYIKALIK